MGFIGTILTIIIIVLIFIGIWYLLNRYDIRIIDYKEEKIYGGDGISINNYGNPKSTHNIVCSEQVLAQTRYKKANDYIQFDFRSLNHFTGQCLMKLKDNATLNYFDGTYLVNANIKPKFMSDSLLDGINLCLNNSEIKQIFVKNEMRSDSWIDKTVELNLDKSTSYLIKRNDPNIELSKTNETLNNIIGNNINPNIYIYLEFCYGDFTGNKFPIFDLYLEIHDYTLNIIDGIIKNDLSYRVYIYRYVINKSLTNTGHKFKLNDSKISAYCHDGDVDNKFNRINIPKTEEYFKMDEFLLIQTDKYNFYVQIEHSENMENHKSNIVEFIMRIGNIFKLKNATIHKFIQKFGYEVDGNNKFNFHLMKNLKSIPEKSVFNILNKDFMKEYF